MEAAIITVGDELLSGDVADTNSAWLAARLTERGVDVRQIVTLPDDRGMIEAHVREYADARDAVLVTGGLGDTPDDVTMEAVAAAFDRELVVDPEARADVEARVEEVLDRRPQFELDVEFQASVPEGAEVLINDEGIAPGCVIENVFVFPGIPDEMKAMFRGVEGRFEGERYSRTAYTDRAESNLKDLMRRVESEFGVSVGCYPDPDGGDKRLTVTADDPARVEDAFDRLSERLDSDDAVP